MEITTAEVKVVLIPLSVLKLGGGEHRGKRKPSSSHWRTDWLVEILLWLRLFNVMEDDLIKYLLELFLE